MRRAHCSNAFLHPELLQVVVAVFIDKLTQLLFGHFPEEPMHERILAEIVIPGD